MSAKDKMIEGKAISMNFREDEIVRIVELLTLRHSYQNIGCTRRNMMNVVVD